MGSEDSKLLTSSGQNLGSIPEVDVGCPRLLCLPSRKAFLTCEAELAFPRCLRKVSWRADILSEIFCSKKYLKLDFDKFFFEKTLRGERRQDFFHLFSLHFSAKPHRFH
jgi:hypothetical protein